MVRAPGLCLCICSNFEQLIINRSAARLALAAPSLAPPNLMERETAQVFCHVAEKLLAQSEFQIATTKHFLSSTGLLQSQIGLLAAILAPNNEITAEMNQKIEAFSSKQNATHKALFDAIAQQESAHDASQAQLIELKKRFGMES
jgi:hypothetical protein